MPRRSNKYPGIQKQADGTYLARAYFDRREHSRQFSRLADAQRWREKLLSELRIAPGFAHFDKNLWSVEVLTPHGPLTYESDDLASVVRWHDQTQAAVAAGTWVSPEVLEMTVGDLVTVWRSQKMNISGKTIAGYNSLLRKHIASLEGYSLVRLSTSQIQQWVQDLHHAGIGPVAIRSAHRLLRSILQLGVERGFLPANPAQGISLPRKQSKPMRALTADELERLSLACGSHATFVRFAGQCGPRFGEAVALQVRHFNFLKGTVRIEQAWTTDEFGRRVLDDTKTRKAREIPVPRSVLKEVEQLCAGKGAGDYVFTGAGGGPLNDGYFRKSVWLPALERTGLQGVHFHDLRHTAASLLIRIGTPITEVSRILGHESSKMTLDVYAHCYEGDGARWMQQLDDYVQAAKDAGTEQERSNGSLRIAQ